MTIQISADGSDQIFVGDYSSAAPQQVLDYIPGGLTGDTLNISNISNNKVDITVYIDQTAPTVIASDQNLANVQQEVTFTGANEILTLDEPESFAGTICNFQPGDTIDLGGISAESATIELGGVLLVQNSDGSTFSLQLDPSQSYSGVNLLAVGDGGDGTDIINAPAAPTGSGSQTVTVSAPGADSSGHATTYSASVSLTPTDLQFAPTRTDEWPAYSANPSIPITVTYTGGNPDPKLSGRRGRHKYQQQHVARIRVDARSIWPWPV